MNTNCFQNGIQERVRSTIDSLGISDAEFARSIDYSRANLSQALKGKRKIPEAKLAVIARVYNIRYNWLLTGEGTMKDGEQEQPKRNGIPYYAELPVSAGQAGLVQIGYADEEAVGSINIAGVTGKYAFPVVGCSMEPVIHAGDIVVVDEVNQWDRIDPDKIYLIITHDDRMIKHLELDDEDTAKLWCISPNYKRFSIYKQDIIRLYRVTFYGRLA